MNNKNNYREILAIMNKELKSYFLSPIAYIIISVFLIATGVWFFAVRGIFFFNQADLRNLFESFPFLFCFFIPAITMRLFSEERQSGSFELLMTLPVSTLEVVIGKVLAGTVLVMVMVAPTLIYVITVYLVGSPDYGPIIGGYIGTIFVAFAYVSIGAFISAMNKNQIIAFVISMAICSFLFWIDLMVIFLPNVFSFMQNMGLDFHFENISRGIIDTRDIIYFISVTIISVLFTVKVLDERR